MAYEAKCGARPDPFWAARDDVGVGSLSTGCVLARNHPNDEGGRVVHVLRDGYEWAEDYWGHTLRQGERWPGDPEAQERPDNCGPVIDELTPEEVAQDRLMSFNDRATDSWFVCVNVLCPDPMVQPGVLVDYGDKRTRLCKSCGSDTWELRRGWREAELIRRAVAAEGKWLESERKARALGSADAEQVVVEEGGESDRQRAEREAMRAASRLMATEPNDSPVYELARAVWLSTAAQLERP